MNAELPSSKPIRVVSSSEVEMFGAAAGEAAKVPITFIASSVGPSGSDTVVGPERMLPPAESTSALNQTVNPSYLFAWTWINAGLPCAASLSASLIIWSQVVGAFFTRSLRYQRSWVFELNGAP